MISWKNMDSPNDVHSIIEDSHNKTQLIFKHSTSCSISSIAKSRLESDWDVEEVTPHYLDLLSYRSISNMIADELSVHHESPQIIMIRNGEAFHDASHLDISISEIKEALQYQLDNE